MVCPAFNADFDGDQMAVHVPLSPEAQAEAREIMAAPKSILKPGKGEPVVASKLLDILLGAYWMTKEVAGMKGEGMAFATQNAAILSYDYRAVGFQAKIKVTQSGITWSLDDIRIPPEKDAIVDAAQLRSDDVVAHWQNGLLSEEERYRMNIEIWHAAKADVEKLIPLSLPKNGPVEDMLRSGARGSLAQMTQMVGMKGLIASPSGETIELPVTKSMKEGLSPIDYFTTTHGSRSGLASTALSTAKAGYMTRRLFDVAQDVVVVDEDCGTKEGLVIRRESASGIGTFMAKNINGRYLASDIEIKGKVLYKKGQLLTETDSKSVEEAGAESVYVRSPIGCVSTRGICMRCYGADLGTMKPVAMGEAVGTVAAQAIGEPGTQLTMNIKHKGGAASAEGDVTDGLPRVEEIFERRAPRNPAVVAGVSGEVVEIRDDGKEKVIVVAPDIEHIKAGKKSKETIEYEAHVRRIPTVKVGSRIEKGQLLTDGSADLSELFKYAGKQKAQEYVMAEVIKIYELQGASISIKHVEVIIRQMFSRVKITQSGNTEYSAGDVATSADFDRANEAAHTAGGEAAKGDPMVMGILDVSLSRASFLSAASFQNTTRMLIKASIYCALDKLEGLKENVILGRLIPAGTGFKGSVKEKLVNKYAPVAGELVETRVRPPLARGE